MKELMSVARKVSKAVSIITGVQAITLYGSLAEGFADNESDINLLAICSTIPNKEIRRKRLEKKFEWIVFKNGTMPDWRTKSQDFFFVDGKNITILYKKESELNFIVDMIKADDYISRDLFRETLAYVSTSKTIYDPSKIMVKLKVKMPKATPQLLKYFLPSLEHLSTKEIWPRTRFRQALKRGNYWYVGEMVDMQIENFLICLHAINNKHYTSPMWAVKSVKGLPLKPTATVSRLQKIAQLGNSPKDTEKKLHLLTSLVSDFKKLIIDEKVFNFLE
jgi:predicted nucleotidyltransferase